LHEHFALELGLEEAEFKGDLVTIIEALNNITYNQAAFGLIIEDARILASSMHSYLFSHIKHSGNSVAHALARQAQHCTASNVWMDTVPSKLDSLLSFDLSL
jgi:hypothetical protein